MLTDLLTRLAASRRDRPLRDGAGRDGETAKLLLRHTTVDMRQRGEKTLERLRA
jgi:hypothetical protein